MELTIFITVTVSQSDYQVQVQHFYNSQFYLLEVHSVFTNKSCMVCRISDITWLLAPQASNHSGHPKHKLLIKNIHSFSDIYFYFIWLNNLNFVGCRKIYLFI